MKNLKLIPTAIFFLLFNSFLICQDEDIEGSKDYPLFNRMPGFKICSFETKDFEAVKFPVESTTDESGKKETIEGKYYYYYYCMKSDARQVSMTQIFRNFENAFNKINSKIVAKVIEPNSSYNFITAKFTKNNMEIWLLMNASDVDYYFTIIEKQVMEQVIQANEMLDAINKDGFIALNILFDTGKSTIKEESQPIIDQIHSMLKGAPDLKVSIEGHTDNTGTAQGNLTLSEARAKAVADALTAKGIEVTRLSSKGWGQEKPVADNRTDEGRAKNRRVEIVKK